MSDQSFHVHQFSFHNPQSCIKWPTTTTHQGNFIDNKLTQIDHVVFVMSSLQYHRSRRFYQVVGKVQSLLICCTINNHFVSMLQLGGRIFADLKEGNAVSWEDQSNVTTNIIILLADTLTVCIDQSDVLARLPWRHSNRQLGWSVILAAHPGKAIKN
jgi:hypothetical protein